MLLAKTGPDATKDGEAGGGVEVVEIAVNSITPNPRQPRWKIDLDDPELAELASSIEMHGIIQPVLVRKSGPSSYQLIAGERRFRASQKLGRTTIPAIVRQADEEEILRLALIENIQRKDLNPIEKAEAIAQLIEDFDLTQEEAAKKVGKQRSTVANLIRLLELEPEIKDAVSRGTITFGHARALLGVSSKRERLELFKRITTESFSVRKIEAEVRKKAKKPRMKKREAQIEALEDKLRDHFGTRVQIDQRGRGGKFSIYFANNSEFGRLMDLLGVSLED
jgi:ParB family chromosome partitioning protein